MGKPSILIVEDDAEMCETLSDILSEEGYDVITTGMGREGLTHMKKRKCPICLIDLKLPDISGIEVLKGLKAFNPETTAIIITAFASKETAIEALKAGAYCYIEKPLSMEELLTTVKRASDAFQLQEDKKRAEEELRKSEEKYRSLVESTEDSVYLVDLNCKYLFMNENHLSRLGLSRDHYLGRAYHAFHSAEDVKRFAEKIDLVFENGTSVQHEYRDREGKCYLKTLSPVKDPKTGMVTGVTVVSKDITELKCTEKELVETRDYLDNIIESSADTITVVDMNGIVHDWNKAGEGIMGYRADEVIGTHNRKFFADPEEADRIMELVRRGGEIKNYRAIVVRKDGKPIQVCMSAALLKDKKGVPIGTVRVSRDITEWMRAEEELRESKERLSSFMDSATDSFTLFDSELNFVEVDKTALERLGLNKKDVIGKNILDLLLDVKKTGRYDRYMEVINTGKPFFVDDIVSHPKLGDMHLAVRVFKVGKGLGVITTDITERKRAEDALRASEKQLRDIFESMADGVYLVSEDYEVEFMNKVLRDEFGDQVGGICHSVFHGRADPCPKCKHLEVMKGKTVRWEWNSRRRNKTYDLIETPLRNIDGTISKLTIFRDITERKKAEEIKTEFLCLTSHELRTPLTPMKTQLEMLQEGYKGKMNEKQKVSVEVVLRNLTRLDNLIEDILDISRIEAGRIRMYLESMSISDAVKEAIKMQEPFAKEKDLKISARLAELPTIIGDAERLRQVISNLLNNAIKFSKKSANIVIETRRVGENVLFRITDYGIGISKEDKEKLFKPFSQIDPAMGREHGGTGLGLAIAKGIIQAHNGKIWVESEPGKGSTFYFSIPIKQKIVEKDAPYVV